MKKWIMGGICLYLLILFAQAAIETRNTITFQGYLTDYAGKPVFGDKKMAFKFFPTKAGGSATDEIIATNESSNKRVVTVYNGNYATKITFTTAELTALNSVTTDVWVEVYVTGSDDNNNIYVDSKKMSPRIQLTSVPYALNVRGIYYVSGSYPLVKIGEGYRTANAVANNANGMIVEGAVGIGTKDPGTAYKLTVQGWVTANRVYNAVWN